MKSSWFLLLPVALIFSCSTRIKEKSKIYSSNAIVNLDDQLYNCNEIAYKLILESKTLNGPESDSILIEAIDSLNNCLKLDSLFVPIYINKANAYYYLNDRQNSIKSLEDGFMATQHPSLLFTIGLIYEKDYDSMSSKQYYMDALKYYDTLIQSNLFTTSDEINRELVRVMLIGKHKTLEDLKMRKRNELDTKRIDFIIELIKPITKNQIIDATFDSAEVDSLTIINKTTTIR